MKRIGLKPIIFLLVTIVLIPLVLGIGVKIIDFIPYLNKIPGGNSDWIGFWGSFIGSILGIGGSILIFQQQMEVERESTQKQISETRNQIREEKIDNTFFNLVDLYTKNRESMPNIAYSQTYSADGSNKTISELINTSSRSSKPKEDFEVNIYSQILNEIFNKVEKDTKKKYALKQQGYILKNIEEIKRIFEEIDDNVEDWYIFKDLLSVLKRYTESESGFLIESFNYSFLNLSARNNNYVDEQLLNYYKSKSSKLSSLYTILMTLEKEELTYGEKIILCTNVISYYYETLGNSFRLFHRIIKYLNENALNEKEKSNYIGILRALFSEKEMLVFFYNAFYTKKGEGLREKLKGTNFFGNEKDLPLNENNELQHFSHGNLIFMIEDIKLMRECCQ